MSQGQETSGKVVVIIPVLVDRLFTQQLLLSASRSLFGGDKATPVIQHGFLSPRELALMSANLSILIHDTLVGH